MEGTLDPAVGRREQNKGGPQGSLLPRHAGACVLQKSRQTRRIHACGSRVFLGGTPNMALSVVCF